MRILCTTDYCGLLDAQMGHARQQIASALRERDVLAAQLAQLAADNARLCAELDAERVGREMYMELFCEEKGRGR